MTDRRFLGFIISLLPSQSSHSQRKYFPILVAGDVLLDLGTDAVAVSHLAEDVAVGFGAKHFVNHYPYRFSPSSNPIQL
jgi:hypothetical protein